MMEGEEESLQLRIDVSLDQDKDENQDQEITCSQSAENSDVDVVTLESDRPPLSSSSSSSSDGTMSGPEQVEIISPNTLQKCSNLLARGSSIYHLQRDAIISQLSLLTRVRQSLSLLQDRQNFRKRTESFRQDECRQKLFHFYKDQFGLGRYLFK